MDRAASTSQNKVSTLPQSQANNKAAFANEQHCGHIVLPVARWMQHSDPLFLPTVSHHPPISAFYYVSPQNKVCVIGELRPKSKFLGNSVSTTMEGENRVYLLGRPEDKGACVRRP